jgi:predicted alpha/beta-hydrolase family hydrolase
MPLRNYPASATGYPASATGASLGVLVLAHGAGAGQTHPFMVTYARGLSARGLDVVTFDFPYVEQGRRSPDRAPVLEEAFRSAVASATGTVERASTALGARRVFIGGKSMGGRMAVRLAADPDAWPSTLPPIGGVIVFGYPLRPPGGKIGDRGDHFAHLSAPALIVQGTRDSFGGPDDIRSVATNVTVHAVDGGDHSFGVPKSARLDQQSVHAQIMDAVIEWVRSRSA